MPTPDAGAGPAVLLCGLRPGEAEGNRRLGVCLPRPAFRGRSLPPLGTERRMEPGGLGAGSALPRPRGQLSGPRELQCKFL